MSTTRTRPAQNTFTGGEWSPLMEGRTDLAKYFSAVQRLQNFVLQPQGGVTRRPGTRFVVPAKSPADVAPRLIPFTFSTEQAYMLEIGVSAGAGYIRFYRNGGQIAGPLELASPYAPADLAKISHTQSANTMYLACEGYAPRKLTRTSHTDWRLRVIAFRPPATTALGHVVTPALTLGAVTGTGITVTAAAAFFLPGDDGRQLTEADGRAVITSYFSSTQVTVDILDAFASVSIAADAATLTGSPLSTLTATPSNKIHTIGAQATLTSDVPASVFRAGDVGKYVRLQNGIAKITAFTSESVVRAEVLAPIDSTDGTPDWTLESNAWSATEGFPVAVGFSPGNRLCWGRDELVWGSVVDDYENMAATTLDDDAFTYGLRSSRVNVIRWLYGTDELYAGTSGGPFVLLGSTDGPLTPTNVHAEQDVTDGCAAIGPCAVGPVSLYVDDSGRSLRELVYDFESDRRVAPDMLLLAGHLVPQGTAITGIAYQRTPHSILWAMRSDGALLGLTHMRAEEVLGWHQHPIGGGGLVRSVAVMPHWDGGRDVAWFTVERVISGTTKFYIEYFDDTGLTYDTLNLDSALTYDGAATTTVTGLEHLEGQTVKVVADGAVFPDQTVSAGAITLARAVSQIEVGLMYTSVLTTMRPEIPTGAGTTQGVQKRIAEVVVRLYQTINLLVGTGSSAERMKFRSGPDSLSASVPLFSGDKIVAQTGWDREGRVTLTQDQPLPCTILMVSTLVGTGA